MKVITGRLLDALDQFQRFLRHHLPIPHEIKGFSPEAKSELLDGALRIRLIKQPTGNDIGIDIRDFKVLLTTPRLKLSRLAAI
jgi:hypothetical protein